MNLVGSRHAFDDGEDLARALEWGCEAARCGLGRFQEGAVLPEGGCVRLPGTWALPLEAGSSAKRGGGGRELTPASLLWRKGAPWGRDDGRGSLH